MAASPSLAIASKQSYDSPSDAMSVVSESELPEGKIRWCLSLDVKIDGIELPFRLRFSTDNHEDMLEALADFHSMLMDKIEERLK
jgi:hypothetical protein